MNNHDCAVGVLEAHREARRWTDDAVAADLLAQLGLDPSAEAKNAVLPAAPGITEDEVVALEAAARDAMDKAHAARAELHGQTMSAEDKADPWVLNRDHPLGIRQSALAREQAAHATPTPVAIHPGPSHPAFPAPPAAPAPVMPAAPVVPAAS